jgi:hypothetical protein
LWTLCNSIEGVIHVHVRLDRGNVTCNIIVRRGVVRVSLQQLTATCPWIKSEFCPKWSNDELDFIHRHHWYVQTHFVVVLYYVVDCVMYDVFCNNF